MRIRFSVENLIMYFIAISLLMGSSCMWFLSMPMASLDGIRNIQYIFLAIFCTMGCFNNGKMRIKQKSILVLLLLVIYLLLYIVITRSNSVIYLTKHVLIFIIFFFYGSTLIREGKVGEFAKVFVNVVSVIAFISLFFWLFGSVLGFIKGVSTPYIWGGNRTTVNYLWLYFENKIQATEILGHTVIRNTGIYAEAPGFSGYLIIALAIAIPSEKGQFPLWQKILLLITMFSTLSTKGIITVMLLIALTYLLTNPAKSAQKFILKCGFTIIIIAAVSIGIFYILEDKSHTNSFLIRMDDVQSAISTWKNHVIFGAGYQETEEIIQNFAVSRGNDGLSMGLTILLAQGGIYMFAFYALSLILALYTSSRMDKSLFMKVTIFGFMIVFNLLISSFHYDPTTIFIIACGNAFACTAPSKHSYKAGIVSN